MPNWCNNQLTVKGLSAEVQRFRLAAVGHNPWGQPRADELPNILNFHSLVPIPAYVLAVRYEKLGYDWEVEYWGCRWGACDSVLIEDQGSRLIYKFETAWGPPTPFLKHLGKLWPDLKFLLEYAEAGLEFKGLCKAHGDLHEHHQLKF